MRIRILPDLQVLELLLQLKGQQLTGFSWLVLNPGSLWHRVSTSKGCGSAGSDSQHSPRSCLKIKHYKSGFHLLNPMEKQENMKIMVGSVSAQLWRVGAGAAPLLQDTLP